jgi:hypothetical protein
MLDRHKFPRTETSGRHLTIATSALHAWSAGRASRQKPAGTDDRPKPSAPCWAWDHFSHSDPNPGRLPPPEQDIFYPKSDSRRSVASARLCNPKSAEIEPRRGGSRASGPPRRAARHGGREMNCGARSGSKAILSDASPAATASPRGVSLSRKPTITCALARD